MNYGAGDKIKVFASRYDTTEPRWFVLCNCCTELEECPTHLFALMVADAHAHHTHRLPMKQSNP